MLGSLLGSGKPRKVVPVVDLKGAIGGGGLLPMGRSLTIDGLRGALTEAFNTRGAVAVALNVNSPGGSPAQSELIGNLIRQLAEEKNIPVYAFVQDLAASGGYWLANAADKIYSARSSLVGSVGVISGGYGYNKLLEKLGLEARIHRAGDAKVRNHPAEEEKPADVEWLKDKQKVVHRQFRDWIKERRGGRLTVPEGEDRDDWLDEHILNGEVFLGEEGLEKGLIDGIGSIDSVLKKEFGDKVKIKWPAAPGGIGAAIRRRFGLAAEGADTGGIGAEAVREAYEIMRNELAYAPYNMG